jgi:hypothetical protein
MFGCYAHRNSAMILPALGTFGTMGRNIFCDTGFRDWDLSVTKLTKFQERLTMQFRAEYINILNHPNFANRYGGQVALVLALSPIPRSRTSSAADVPRPTRPAAIPCSPLAGIAPCNWA